MQKNRPKTTQNKTPNENVIKQNIPKKNVDKNLGLIVRKGDFDEEMAKYIIGVMQYRKDDFEAYKQKRMVTGAPEPIDVKYRREDIIEVACNDMAKKYPNYEFDIIRTDGKIDFWGNSQYYMFVSFGSPEQDNYLILASEISKK